MELIKKDKNTLLNEVKSEIKKNERELYYELNELIDRVFKEQVKNDIYTFNIIKEIEKLASVSRMRDKGLSKENILNILQNLLKEKQIQFACIKNISRLVEFDVIINISEKDLEESEIIEKHLLYKKRKAKNVGLLLILTIILLFTIYNVSTNLRIF